MSNLLFTSKDSLKQLCKAVKKFFLQLIILYRSIFTINDFIRKWNIKKPQQIEQKCKSIVYWGQKKESKHFVLGPGAKKFLFKTIVL